MLFPEISRIREVSRNSGAGDNSAGRVRGLLPVWDRERGVRRLVEKGFLVEGSFLHNNVGNPDPVLIYSRDSMHQASA